MLRSANLLYAAEVNALRESFNEKISMGEKKVRLTERELDMSHNGLCGQSIGDGPCSCLVQWVKGLQKESDDQKKSIEELLMFVVQSNEFNDEQCSEEIKDRVRRARDLLGLPR